MICKTSKDPSKMKRTQVINSAAAAAAASSNTTAASTTGNKRTATAAALLSSSDSVSWSRNNKAIIMTMDACLYLGILLISIHILYQQHFMASNMILQQNRQQEQQQPSATAPTTTTSNALVSAVDCMMMEAGESHSGGMLLQSTAVDADKKKKGNTTTTTDSSFSYSTNNNNNNTGDSGSSNNTANVIDMISISSHSRPHYPVVQQASFGSHRAVRHFWTFTEDDDDDQACHKNMTVEMVQQVANLCRQRSTYAKLPLLKRHFAPTKWLLEKTKNPVGWLCAQKRPLTALHKVLQGYSYDNHNHNNKNSILLPDYLLVMDDDSWFHLENMLPVLQQDYPPQQAHLIAGCLIRSPKDERFAFYWGGFGILLTKAVLERLLVPLACNANNNNKNNQQEDDVDWSRHLTEPTLPGHTTMSRDALESNNQDFVQYACHKIALNLIGEQYFYRPNMTLMDLIYQYGLQQPYSQFDQWRLDATYCMHSDITLTYFWQYYHVAAVVAQHTKNHHSSNASSVAVVDYDQIEAYRGSTKIRVSDKGVKPPIYQSRGECAHISNDDCTIDSHLCHYVTATHMKELFEAIQRQAAPGLYQHTVAMPEIEFEDPIAKHPDALKNQKKRQEKADRLKKGEK